jgi:hypothetical protein
LKWLSPVISIFSDANSENVEYQLKQFLPTTPRSTWDQSRYIRIQGEIFGDKPDRAMDNASPEQYQALFDFADQIAKAEKSNLLDACDILLRYRKAA